MKKIIALTLALTFSLTGRTLSFNEAETAAQYLNVEFVILEKESRKSYFYITEIEYAPDDVEEEYPCFRGVVVSKKTGTVVDPSTDEGIITSFPYSDTFYDGFVVINCAD